MKEFRSRRKLLLVNAKLRREIRFLEEEISLKEKQTESAVREELYRQAAVALGEKFDMIRKVAGSLPMSQADLVERLNKICIIGGYIKRRCNLILLSEEQDTVPSIELYLCLRESQDYLIRCGLQTAVFMDGADTCSVRTVMLAYDFIEQFVEMSFESISALLLRCTVREDILCMKVQAEVTEPVNIEELRTSADVAAFGGSAESRYEDGVQYVSIMLPNRIGEDLLPANKMPVQGEGSAESQNQEKLNVKRWEEKPICANDPAQWACLDLEEDNRNLTMLRDHLLSHRANVSELSRRRELLNLKIKVHNELGRLLLRTGQFIEKAGLGNIPCSTDGMRIWNEWNIHMEHLFLENSYLKEHDLLRQMLETANSIGLSLDIKGDFPGEDELAELVFFASGEMMSNTIRHAKGKNVNIMICQRKTDWKIEFANDGRPPQEDSIREGGGLSAIRKKTEALGGVMKVSARPAFVLTLILPRKGGTGCGEY